MNKSKTAVKLISFFMVILMAFGAFPVALAADGDIVTKWPTAVKEIEYGQKYADAGLTGGESTIPGKFEYVSTTAAPNDVKVVARPVQFVPDDTSVAPVEGTVDVTVIQSKSAVLEGGFLLLLIFRQVRSYLIQLLQKPELNL